MSNDKRAARYDAELQVMEDSLGIKRRSGAGTSLKDAGHHISGHLSKLSSNAFSEAFSMAQNKTNDAGTAFALATVKQTKKAARYTRKKVVKTAKSILGAGAESQKNTKSLLSKTSSLVSSKALADLHRNTDGMGSALSLSVLEKTGKVSKYAGKKLSKPIKATLRRNKPYKARWGKGRGQLRRNNYTSMQKAARKSAQAAKSMAARAVRFARGTVKTMSNPLMIKGIAIGMAGIFVFLAISGVITSVFSIFSGNTYNADPVDLDAATAYIRKLDDELSQKIASTETLTEYADVEEFHYIMNVPLKTSPQKILSYLNAKYGVIMLEGQHHEINCIHEQLYTLTYKKWTGAPTEAPEEESSELPTDESQPDNTEHGEPEENQDEAGTTVHLDVILDGISFEEWLQQYGGLNDDQTEHYLAVLENGVIMLKAFGSPFHDIDWRMYISDSFGYRNDPFTGEVKFHTGVDIALPEGTEINAVEGGTATVIYGDSELGNYIIITKGEEEFIYGHCDQLLVADGAAVGRGDVIATVGNTGKSTGPHLHLTYKRNGKLVDAEEFCE